MLKRNLIFGALLLLGGQASAEVKDFSLYIRKFWGFTTRMDITTDKTKEEIVIVAQEGYARELAQELRISRFQMDKVTITVPYRECTFDEKQPHVISISSRAAKVKFEGGVTEEFESRDFTFTTKQLGDFTTVELSLQGCACENPARSRADYRSDGKGDIVTTDPSKLPRD